MMKVTVTCIVSCDAGVRNVKSFAVDRYVRRLQSARGITLQDISRMLGYSSQTSLTRIMQETASRASLLKFADRLRSCERLALTRAERNQLDDLIELHDIGGEDFETMLKLRQILRGEPADEGRAFSLIRRDGSATTFLAHFAGKRIRRMLLLNSERAPIFQDLALLLEGGSFELEHLQYVKNGAMHTVQSLHAAMPIIYSPRYVGRTFSYDDEGIDRPRGLMTSDILFCEYETAEGRPAKDMIVFDSLCTGQQQTVSSGIDDVMRFLPDRRLMRDMRMCIAGADLLQYNAFCAELERDHAVCRIKPDLALEQIPLDILERAVADCAPAELQQEMRPLVAAMRERQRNIMEKDAPQYHIFKRGAMLRFARTGRLSDHLWCCRAFTVEERVSILRYLRDTLMALPGFNLYFLKDDAALREDEIILYEDRGLSIIKAGTDYDMSARHAEILITQPEMLKVFKRFFMESTLRYRVESAEDSAAEIDRLISLCTAESQRELTEI